MDPLAQQLSVGGALFLSAWALLLKYKPWVDWKRTTNGYKNNDKAGDKTPEYWREEMRKVLEDVMRHVLATRNEEIREIVRDELESFRRASEHWRRRRFDNPVD